MERARWESSFQVGATSTLMVDGFFIKCDNAQMLDSPERKKKRDGSLPFPQQQGFI